MNAFDDLAFSSAATQARLLAEGRTNAPAVVDVALGRIERADGVLNAFRVVRADAARREAIEAQQRLDAGDRRPLLGVPIAVKDDIDVAGEVTAWGTAAHGPAVDADAEVVRRLREAGAIVVGKTNVPEMTIWPFTESETFGATRNPWDTTRTPGGSSGGTAAAVAAGFVALGVGSDGGGSIRIPSTWCGLFGLKPQRDRVPMAPHDDAWHGLTVNGPIARTVEDAALLLDITSTMPAPTDGFVAVTQQDPGRLRIAVTTKAPPGLLGRAGRAQRAAVHECAELLRALGHDVVERDLDTPLDAGANVLARYLRGIHDDVGSMPHPERLERRTRSMARIGGLVSPARVAAARRGEAALAARVNAIFDDVDVVLLPSNAGPPPRIGADRGRGALRTSAAVMRRVPFHALFNATGQPAAAVPWDLDRRGLPVGVQLAGRPSDEATLLALSAQIERARPWANRRPPESAAAI